MARVRTDHRTGGRGRAGSELVSGEHRSPRIRRGDRGRAHGNDSRDQAEPEDPAGNQAVAIFYGVRERRARRRRSTGADGLVLFQRSTSLTSISAPQRSSRASSCRRARSSSSRLRGPQFCAGGARVARHQPEAWQATRRIKAVAGRAAAVQMVSALPPPRSSYISAMRRSLEE